MSADAGWPSWLRKQLRADWGDQAETIFEASAQMAPMWLRVQRSRIDPAGYVAGLAALGIAAETDAVLPDAVRLHGAVPVSQLPGFAEGDVSVQDGSAQQVADALVLAPSARVLDACAAPGGKAAHLLERHRGLQLTALDVDARRLERVQQTLQRTVPGAQVTLHAADAAETDAWWDGQPFDAVLLDAPCSATGVVRRQPDVLLHRRADDIDALCALQARLLDASWRTLRPGGQLLYTTCSCLRARTRRRWMPSCNALPTHGRSRWVRNSGMRPVPDGSVSRRAALRRFFLRAFAKSVLTARRTRRSTSAPTPSVMLKTRASKDFWLLAITAVLVIGAGLGLRDPWPSDEPRFALVAKQMVMSGDWLFPHRGNELYSDKPPMLMWLQALFCMLLGNWRVAFLLPSLLAALGTLACVYDLGRRLWTRRVGPMRPGCCCSRCTSPSRPRRRRSIRWWCSGSPWPITDCCAICCWGRPGAGGRWAGSPPG